MSDPTPPSHKTSLWILLGLMTLFSFAGPFLIFLVCQGGNRKGWPPDRPIEWWTIGLISGVVVMLMAACVTVGAWSRRA